MLASVVVFQTEAGVAKRLISLKQIRAEKIDRSRSWIFAEIVAGRFPKPVGGCVPHLWEEDVIDRYVDEFIAAAKQRSAVGEQRIAKAAAARAQRRDDQLAA